MKSLLSQAIFWRYTLSGHIIVIFSTCGTSSTNGQIAISQQEIVEMLRKLAPRVIYTYKIKFKTRRILNQNSYILGNL